MHCYSKTISEEGFFALWNGWGANVMRNSVINASKLASYDQFKQICLQNLGWSDGKATQIACAMASGLVATLVGSPFDVTKTRLMQMKAGESPFGLIGSMIKSEGPMAFYKGFGANFLRLSGWNVAMFLTFE